jgi:hypothetical protein
MTFYWMFWNHDGLNSCIYYAFGNGLLGPVNGTYYNELHPRGDVSFERGDDYE